MKFLSQFQEFDFERFAKDKGFMVVGCSPWKEHESNVVLGTKVALLLHFLLPTRIKIKRMVQRGLFYYPLGNPLNLKQGELLPKVKVREIEKGKYEIKIRVTAFSFP